MHFSPPPPFSRHIDLKDVSDNSCNYWPNCVMQRYYCDCFPLKHQQYWGTDGQWNLRGSGCKNVKSCPISQFQCLFHPFLLAGHLPAALRAVFHSLFQGMALFGRGRSDYDNLASESPSLKGLLLLSAQQDDHLCLALHWTGMPTCIFIHSLNLWNSDRSVCKLMDFALWVCGHMLITLEFPLERKSKCQFCNTNCNCHSRSSAVSFVWPETCWNPARRRHFFAWKPFKQYW